MKKSHLKAVVAILCFCFLLMAVPNLNSAEKRAVKLDLSPRISQPGLLLNVLFPWLNPIFDRGSKPTESTKSVSGRGIVRPTDDVNTGKPGTGD